VPVGAELEISESTEPLPTVTVAGEIDHFNSSRAETAIKRLLATGIKVLIIDLTRVVYVDTAGVAMIFWTAKRLMDRDGNLRLVIPPGDVRRILELAGVGSLPATSVYETLQESLKA
jgi:anti-anti-sigma factor